MGGFGRGKQGGRNEEEGGRENVEVVSANVGTDDWGVVYKQRKAGEEVEEEEGKEGEALEGVEETAVVMVDDYRKCREACHMVDGRKEGGTWNGVHALVVRTGHRRGVEDDGEGWEDYRRGMCHGRGDGDAFRAGKV